MSLYPVALALQKRLCLIVGGGEVAARKIEPLLACGARIRMVSPEACASLRELADEGRIEWLPRGYQAGDLQGAFLVFAATNNGDVQRLVVHEAKERNILVNSADNPEVCTFQVPAAVRQGDLLLAVSTGGGSPALSAMIRKKLAQEYGPEYGLLVGLLASIRGMIVGDGDSPFLHKVLFERILETDVLSCIRDQDWPTLQARLAMILPATINVAELVANISSNGSPEDERCGRELLDG
jgi:precorrin-2 dehydrogenase / sirohydrochlorin ferrochelatase